MRILLVYPPSVVRWNLLPPLGMAALAAGMRRAGNDCSQLNLEIGLAQALRMRDDPAWRLTLCRGAIQEDASDDEVACFEGLLDSCVSPEDFDVVGLSLVGEAQLTSAIRVARWFGHRNPCVAIALGGALAVANPGRVRAAAQQTGVFDMIMTGADGGASFLKWVSTMGERSSTCFEQKLGRVGVVSGEKGGDYYFEGCFAPQAELAGAVYGLRPSGPMLQFPVSMGCTARCGFCTRRHLDLRRGDPQAAAVRIGNLARDYQCRFFKLECDTLNLSRSWLGRFTETLINCSEGLIWNAYARPRGLDGEQLASVRRAGCCMLRFGVESGSDRVLQKMGKGFSVREAEAVLRRSRRAGLWNGVLFMVGTPGETDEDTAATTAFISRNAHLIDSAIVNVFQLLAGTTMFHHPTRFGVNLRSLSSGQVVFDDLQAGRAWHEHLEFCVRAHDGVCAALIENGIGLMGTSPDLLQLALMELEDHDRVKGFLRSEHPLFFTSLPHHAQRWALYNGGLPYPSDDFTSPVFHSRFGYFGVES